MCRVLVVEDDTNTQKLLCEILKRDTHEVKGVKSVVEALEVIVKFDPEVVMIDLNLNGQRGEVLIKKLPHEDCVAIILTGQELTEDERVAMLENGVNVILQKPTSPRIITAHVRNAGAYANSKRAVRQCYVPDTLLEQMRSATQDLTNLIGEQS